MLEEEAILKPPECSISRREMHSISSRGPFVFTYVLFWGSKSLEHFKNLMSFSDFFLLQNVLFDGTDGTGRTGRDGRDGTDGWDGPQKFPLIFFILRYIKQYTHIYICIYKKIVPTNFLWV